MRRAYKGSFTIEAAVIVPLILLVFIVILNSLFYYHDRNVIAAAAYETVAVGSGREEWTETELETYFQERTKGRMLLFSKVEGQVTLADTQVKIACVAKKKSMTISVKRVMRRTEPENYIRNIRKIEKIQEELGD
ncbi:MAG: pilus assembly protein [Tyzzerella sp.]|nr:pilus assembly protein [Tyzzerella sp.]